MRGTVFATILRWLDLPPSWLALCVGAAWGLDRLVPGLGLGLGWMHSLGTGLIALGVGAMGMALWEFLRACTTLMPRQIPSAFLRRGIYRLTRNPIYLGDVLVLAKTRKTLSKPTEKRPQRCVMGCQAPLRRV